MPYPVIGMARRAGLIAIAAAFTALAHAQTPPQKTVLMSLSKASEPFMLNLRAEAEDEAGKLGLKLIVEDGKGDSALQAAGLEAALSRGGIDAVLLAPNDLYSLAPAVNQALRQGLPVVTVDRRMSGTIRPIPHVGVDNVLGGQIMARWVVQRFPKGATVLHLTGQAGSSTAIDRAKGVRGAFAAAGPQYRLVGDIGANWSRAEALLVTEGQLTFLKTPPDAIVAGNDDMAMGALEAIRILGMEKRGIQVIGYDALPFALQKMREGRLAATVDQHGSDLSRTALRRIADFLHNGKAIESVTLKPTLVDPETLKQLDAHRTERP